MILTRSPYYFNQSFPNNYITSIDFTVRIGTGPTNSMNELAEYSITKENPSDDTDNLFIDISPMVRDYYEFEPFGLSGYTSSSVVQSPQSSVMLVECTASFNDSIGSNEDDVTESFIATDGYGYYTDGQNYEPDQKILLSHTYYKADYRGHFIVPLQCDDDDSDPTVNGDAVDLNFIERSYQRVKYLIIPCANYTGTIEVSFEGETILIELVEECKYDVSQVQFLNRFGAIELLHTYKVRKDSFSTTNDNFKNNYTNGTSYNTDVHQIKKYNVNGNQTFTLETGHLTQDYNQTIEELLMSEYVWVNGIPCNVTSKSLDYKTRIVDKLITYTIEFEYAFDQINNV